MPHTYLHPLGFDNKDLYTRTFRNNTYIIKTISSLILVQKYTGHKKVSIYSLPLLFSLSKASFVINWSHTETVSARNLEFIIPHAIHHAYFIAESRSKDLQRKSTSCTF